MGKVTALMMDVITEKSGHTIVPNAVSVCITPAAPSPVPLPYPVVGNVVEGITDPPLRTKVEGQKFATTGSVIKTCHGNEPGTLKETCSLNTGGPCFIIMGAPIVICELGMMGITGALCISNKAVTVGASGSASGAGGAGGPGGSAGGGGAGGAGPNGPSGPSNGGGGGGGSNSGASASAASPGARGSGADAAPGATSGPAGQHQCQNGHPVDMATGHVIDEAVDLEVAGLIPFVLKRFYSSSRRNDLRATLGPGWAHNWETAVWEEASVTVLRDAEGRSIFFEQIPVGGTAFHRGERMELKRLTQDRWEIFHLATRRTYQYEAFEPGGQAALRHVRDAWNNRIELGYEDGRLFVAVDTAGREVHFQWEGARIRRVDVRVGGSSEQSVDYLYAESGCLASVADALGNSETFEYDGQRRMIAASLKTGVTFRYEYEADTGRCSRTWGPKGLYDLVFSSDLDNHRTSADGEEPRVYTVDDAGHVTREALPNGVVLEERAYDQDGLLIAEVNGAGEGVKHWYDARGNVVRKVNGEGQVTAWTYDERGYETSRTSPDGLVTRFEHDHRGGLTRVTFPSGRTFALSYDERGRVIRMDDAEGIVGTYEYDAAHNLVAETDASGARTTYTYDALGRPTARTDATGRTTRILIDRLGRPLTFVRPDGSAIRREYDARGKVIREVDAGGEVTRYAYTGMGVLSQMVCPDGAVWSFVHNAKERPTQIVNPAGERYEYVYDEGGRVVEERGFDGVSTRFEIGLSGRVSKVSYADGTSRQYTYDRAGKLMEDRASDGTVRAFTYDRAGRLLSGTIERGGERHVVAFTRDALGRIVSESQGDHALTYAYDGRGRLVERALAGGSKGTFAYDRLGRPVRIGLDDFGVKLGYDPAGRESSCGPDDGAFTIRHGYDDVGRLTSSVVTSPGSSTPSLQRIFGYDRSGRLSRMVDSRAGSVELRYDAAGSLIEELGVGQQRALRRLFSYDKAGALCGLRDAGAPNERWKTGPGNLLLQTPAAKYAYDKRGRRSGERDLRTTEGPEKITSYVWDVHDRLREVTRADGVRVVSAYDAFGRRVRADVYEPGDPRPKRSTRYVWSGNALVAEIDGEGRSRSFMERPGSYAPLLHREHGETFVCVTDPLGTPKELLDRRGAVAWGARHTPFGELEEEYRDPAREQAGRAPSSPFRLLGQLFDRDAGLAWTRYRVFDARVGRWLSRDPWGIGGSRDLYGFGTPTVEVDPLGLTGSTHPPTSPEITADDLTGKSRTEIREMAADRGLVPAGDTSSPDYPRKWRDPVTGEDRLRLDRGHTDPGTGQPYDNANAAVDHVHGYDSSGEPIRDSTGDKHFPTTGD